MFETKTFELLVKALNGSAMQHTVHSNNMANVNTPGFKRSVVSFRDELEKALEPAAELKITHPRHILAGKSAEDEAYIRVKRINNTSLRNDGNNVDPDMELAAMNENNLYFNTLAQLLSSQLALLRHSISEGRR